MTDGHAILPASWSAVSFAGNLTEPFRTFLNPMKMKQGMEMIPLGDTCG